MNSPIEKWVRRVISGPGGLHDYERFELAVPTIPRDEAVAIWIIQCLGNNTSPDTAAVLDEIRRRREAVMKPGDNYGNGSGNGSGYGDG